MVTFRGYGRSGPLGLGEGIFEMVRSALIVTLLSVGLMHVVAPASGAESPLAAPIVLQGEAVGTSTEGARFTVFLTPRQEVVKRLRVGDQVPVHKLPESAVAADGAKFSVRVRPEDVPSGFISIGGYVDLDVLVVKPGERLVGSVSATVRLLKVRDTGEVFWADASSRYAQRGVPVSESVREASQPARVRVSLRARSRPTAPDDASFQTSGGCQPRVDLIESSDRHAAIAHTFVPDGTRSTAWAYHYKEQSHTFGIAANFGDGWEVSGSRTYAAGIEAEWLPNRANMRSYRFVVRYGKYRYQNEYFDPAHGYGCDVWYKWSPRFDPGGRPAKDFDVTPTWGRSYCQPYTDVKFVRYRTNGNSFNLGGGVLTKSLVGFNLKSTRSYSSQAYIAYKVLGNKKLCGNNNDPAYASSIRMAKTW